MENLFYLTSHRMCVSCRLACHTVDNIFGLFILHQRAPCLLTSPQYYALLTFREQLIERPFQLITHPPSVYALFSVINVARQLYLQIEARQFVSSFTQENVPSSRRF